MSGDPQRIVSLVPSHTETLHDLGLAHRVVGRTRFCIHPSPWVDQLPVVGGTKDATAAKILALHPDLVVADKDENPKALVEELEAAGVEVLWSDIEDVPGAVHFIETLGNHCGVPEAARIVAESTLRTLLEVRPPADAEPIEVFCPIWHNPWMTFDRTAYPSAMLEAVGLHNVFAGGLGGARATNVAGAAQKYFQVEAHHVAASPAQWTLLPTEPYPFHKKKVATADLGAAGTPGRTKVIDGEALTWFGTRTQRGLRELARVAAGLRQA